MQTQPNLTAQRLAALRTVLAAATVECPLCAARDRHLESLGRKVDATIYCAECEGNRDSSGRVARFPDFRQPCKWCTGNSWTCQREGCKGTGWQVRAGGLAAGLAGLSRAEASRVYEELDPFLGVDEVNGPFSTDPMPTEAEIDVAGLRLVCQVARLEVPE